MKTIDCAGIDKQDLRSMSNAELAVLGVRMVNRSELVLGCAECGETWAPQLDASGKLPFDFWRCPASCKNQQ